MTNIDATLEQHILDIAQAERKPYIHHHHEADHLWCRIETAARAGRLCSGFTAHTPRLAGGRLCYHVGLTEPGATKSGADAELAMHPTVKPVPMIMDAIRDTSRPGEIVLDPFGGSGSTLIAAEKTKRLGRLIEYEPGYCEVTIRRWQTLTRKPAILEATGESFTEASARRSATLEDAADAALSTSAVDG